MNKRDSKLFFIHYALMNQCRNVYLRILHRNRRCRKRMVGHKVVSAKDGNDILREKILSGKPFAAVRLGATETATFIEGIAYRLGLKRNLRQSISDTAWRQSGIFPNNTNLIPRYTSFVESTLPQIDFLASFNWVMEDYVIDVYLNKDIIVAANRSIEPFYYRNDHPWSEALEGKKVLVIHPFADTIEKQYAKRELLFPGTNVLPKFELRTLKAVQTIVGTKDERFDDWLEALNWMYEEAMKIDFDVAILGCGGYGQPLACMLKKAGKQAIQIGGATQILFGIKGKRWEVAKSEITKMFNDNWVRPSSDETPLHKERNEIGGAYW